MINFKEIEIAAEIIKDGGVVAFPTETVYGLGANALNPLAVAKIFELKQRPSFDPLIVHISDIEVIKELTIEQSDVIYKLADKFWPGPLTIVLPKSNIVPDIVTSGLGTVGIRMPNSEIALELIKKSNCPIAAPSANKFGQLSPTKAEHVKKQIPSLNCILDGGMSKVGIESTVISVRNNEFMILRHGIITEEDLKKVLPVSKYVDLSKGLASPGLLDSHYSPLKPIYLLDEFTGKIDKKKSALLSFKGCSISGYKDVEILSMQGDLKEAAANLFGALHRLEESTADFIFAESVPAIGIGIAIMDKLKKASHKYKSI